MSIKDAFRFGGVDNDQILKREVHLFGYRKKVISNYKVIIAIVHLSQRDKHISS
jgi:hypothetical protein